MTNTRVDDFDHDGVVTHRIAAVRRRALALVNLPKVNNIRAAPPRWGR
jgi:hypothetical protein